MKKSFRVRGFAPALSVLSLAVAASLHAQTIELDPVVVTATRFSEDPNQLPIGVSVLDEEAIRASGASTVSEALMRLLGIPGRLDTSGGANHMLDLRGFGETANSNQVVIVDGQRLNEADMSAPQLASIPIESIKRIEVLRGSGAVLYGEGATGGVIVITTKAGLGVARRNSASVYSGIGSNRLRELRANATVASGSFSVDVAGQRRKTDNHRQNFRSESDAGSITAQWSHELFRVGARHNQETLDARLPGPLSIAEFKSDPNQIQQKYANDWARINNRRDGVFAEVFLGNWEVISEAGWREKQLRSLNQVSYEYDVDAKNSGLRAKNESQWGHIKNQFVIGHDYNTWNRQVYGQYGSISDQKSNAWFVQDSVTLASGSRFTGGYRTERISKRSGTALLDDRQNAWDLGFSHPLSTGSRIWTRIGESFRLANADEFSFTDPAVSIRPQISKDVEAGWSLTRAGYKIETRIYKNDLTDEIAYDPRALGNGQYDGRNINLDPTQRQGLEIDGRFTIMPKLTLSGNITLRSASFQSGNYAGHDIPLVARETLALRAQWSVAEGHQVTGGVNWVGARYADFDNQCRMPDYTTVDLRYARKFSNAEFSLSANNLLDHQFYTSAICSPAKVLSVYPEAGRTFLAAVRVNF
jgi:iron complex outermembrane receptor protein